MQCIVSPGCSASTREAAPCTKGMPARARATLPGRGLPGPAGLSGLLGPTLSADLEACPSPLYRNFTTPFTTPTTSLPSTAPPTFHHSSIFQPLITHISRAPSQVVPARPAIPPPSPRHRQAGYPVTEGRYNPRSRSPAWLSADLTASESSHPSPPSHTRVSGRVNA